MSASTPVPALVLPLRNFATSDRGAWEDLIDLAAAADRIGVDRVTVSDHVVMGERLEEYGRPEVGGVRGGAQPTGPDGHWLDPIVLLALIAGRTTRVRLGTSILLAGLRAPVVLAKELATLDVLSAGRLDVGVGVGWQREEYDASGLRFADRGRRLDEVLETCRTLWREPRASLHPAGRRVDGIHQMPKPRQSGGVPIWVSGTVNERVARRLARFGSGWIPWGPDAADPISSIPKMRAAVARAGVDPAGLRVVGNLPEARRAGGGHPDPVAAAREIAPLLDAGVTDFVLRVRPPGGGDPGDFLSPWVQAFRAAGGRSV